ncbi:MAG: biliverdin-producing heme oxygenase [Proteobacteria bacterium]|nr:MAG: biliverdin-producing heme oxygenase [Pseudomonadota bacterium]
MENITLEYTSPVSDFNQNKFMVLQRLRFETRSAHEQLEKNIDLLGRAWTMEFYRDLLEKFYGFYSIIEPPIFAHLQWEQVGINVDERRKTYSLSQDLEFIGLGSQEIARLPHCKSAPIAGTFPQALGCAYVLEGSTLGGQVITRHLRRQLGVKPGYGATFFTSYGPDISSKWRDFTNVLNSCEFSEADEDMLVQYACNTFSTFDHWLRDLL